MRSDKVEWLIGQKSLKVCPLQPYSDIVVEFLDELSGSLRRKATKERLSDVQALAFWCRKGNIMHLKEQAGDYSHSLGRGLVFHITPSNVPVNFAFSYFFGLLAGNANIVRIPSKDYRQVDIIVGAIKEVLEDDKYQMIREGTAFVRYGHDKEVTDYFSAMADGRIIWGGDATIETIRQSPMKPKGIEIVFADRFSMGIFDGKAIMDASDEELSQLAKHFYNDTYLMDQNACSTPHLLLWTGIEHKSVDLEAVKERFWNVVAKEAAKYDLEPIKAVDKYTDMCMAAMQDDSGIEKISRWGNRLCTIDIEKLPDDITAMRGQFGMFYQYSVQDIQELADYINERVQTLLYYGVDKESLKEFVIEHHLMGIDRIVPFGKSLDMNVYWDGYDIIRQLSRRISIE